MDQEFHHGKKLAFVLHKNSSVYQVWVSNIDGSNAVQLSNSPLGANWGVAWHPDGQYIYYGDEAVANEVRICKIKTDGTGFKVVLSDPSNCNNYCSPKIDLWILI